MIIKPIKLSKLGPIIKLPYKTLDAVGGAISKNSADIFVKSNKAASKTESEIAQLKLKLQECKKAYNMLKRKLNLSFGDDWIFCYNDLTDKQSDMYIECIAQKSMIHMYENQIEQLMQKTTIA